MIARNTLIVTSLIMLLVSCEEKKSSAERNFSLDISHKNEKIRSEDSLSISVQSKSDKTIDSLKFFYADHLLENSTGAHTLNTILEKPLGRKHIKAKIFSNGKTYTLEQRIVLHSKNRPKLYTYTIKNSYPHDQDAFTQGLEFYNDTLYEGTGEYGASALRKIDYKTGQVLKETKLGTKYFGEGITIMNDKIYQLTWREKVGFIYDLFSFKKLETFDYGESEEGWGLCNDGEKLYKSDGSNKIWILNSETLEEETFIEPVTHNSLANRVNELEWIDGKIYANTWQKDGVLIIDPKTGAVTGVIDFRGLKDHLEHSDKADVLNGIAYNKKTEKLYVTGKRWDKLFEVEIVEK